MPANISEESPLGVLTLVLTRGNVLFMNTTAATTTVMVQLVSRGTYTHTDNETGIETRRVVAKGSWVAVDGYIVNGRKVVPGVARPTMHGGGVHTTAWDLETGYSFSAIVNAYAG
jgi:hypothetical protein